MGTYEFIIHREELASVKVQAKDRDEAYDILWERYTDGDYMNDFEEVQTYIE